MDLGVDWQGLQQNYSIGCVKTTPTHTRIEKQGGGI